MPPLDRGTHEMGNILNTKPHSDSPEAQTDHSGSPNIQSDCSDSYNAQTERSGSLNL